MARLLSADEFKVEANYKAATGVPVAMTDLGELYLLAEMSGGRGRGAGTAGEGNREAGEGIGSDGAEAFQFVVRR